MKTAHRDLLFTAMAPMLWGTTYVLTTELLPQGRPLLVGAIRALPVGLLILLVTRTLPRGVWWWRSVVLGSLNIGLFFALLFVAAYRLPGGVAAALGATQPVWVALLAWPLLRVRPRVVTLGAALMGVIGVTLVVLGPTARLDGVGVAAALGGALIWALGIVLSKRWGQPVSPLVFTGWQLVAGGMLLSGLAVALEGPLPPLTARHAIGFTLLSLVVTGLAFVLWFRGIGRLPAVTVGMLGLLIPVVATVLGWLFLGQMLSSLQLFGLLMVIGSIVVGQRGGRIRSGAR